MPLKALAFIFVTTLTTVVLTHLLFPWLSSRESYVINGAAGGIYGFVAGFIYPSR
jgi:membrane associated rhomboid family serine protease